MYLSLLLLLVPDIIITREISVYLLNEVCLKAKNQRLQVKNYVKNKVRSKVRAKKLGQKSG